MRPASLLAVAVSAVVGVACGVGGGLLFDDKGPIVDPLGLGVALVNQSCTGDTLVMVGWGSRSQLGAGVTEDPDHVRYLDTRNSCQTAWSLEGNSNPRYVAYIGPFATAAQACEVRMTVRYKGDRVTRLNEGNTDLVECVCYLPSASMPLLRSGGTINTDLNSIWIRSLQGMLSDLGFLPSDHNTGTYDLATQTAVKEFQSDRGMFPNGVVNSVTWSSLKTKGCGLYDS